MKLIAVDLDGTLLNSKNELTDSTKEALIDARKHDFKVVIISGRDYHACKNIGKDLDFDKYGGLVSSSNGANVYDMKNKKTIINHYLDKDLAQEMIDFGKELRLDLIINKDGKILVEKEDTYSLDFLRKKNKMEVVLVPDLSKSIDFDVNKILFSKAPHIMETQSKIFIDKYKDLVNPIRSMPQFLDIMPKGINKGRSLLEIADYYKIDHKDTIAFGDEINDIEMIKAAGRGVAMGNASEIIKEAADDITLTNDQDGIAHYIREKIIGR